MKKIIDINSWERRGNYEFFRNFASSWYSVTTEIECTRGIKACKENGESFFLRYLYAVVCAANEVKEMRFRVGPGGEPVLYDRIDIITPVKVEGKSFVTIRVPYEPDYETFCKEARHIIESIDPDDNPYKVENEMAETGNFNVVHLSAVPKLYFTSMSFTLHEIGNPCTHPLSVMGKAVERENGKIIMPYSIYVDHAFVDGEHLTELFNKIQQKINRD